ncbi:MAG TPA: PAS domain-containing sensor histidine kinase, partial [Rhizobiaceae bacterium]|nr:PAS domain-containing sensor histidine kinase [Rhizobiaceae bacterium]
GTAAEHIADEMTDDEGEEPVAEPALEADDPWQPAASQSRLDEWYLGANAVGDEAQRQEEELRTPSHEADAPETAQSAEQPIAEEHGTAAAIDEDFAEDDWARSAIEGPGGGPASNDEMEDGDWGRPELVEAIGEEENEPELEDEVGEPSNLAEVAGDAAADESVATAKEFAFASSSEPVRFAWTVDDHQIFLSVSPELAQTVGPNAADIVGRRWSDVAKVFGFDTSGDIQRLLEKRDTWSGKSVLWPVQGTDLVVPVDLAALPAFSGARQFDGFRGFGIIRTADVIFDPDETGLALVSGPAKPKPESKPAPQGIDTGHDVSRRLQPIDRDDRDTPNGNGRAPSGAAGGNVVDLTSRKRDRGDELSKTEARAFQEIGRKLVEEAPVKPPEPASEFLVETMPARPVADEHHKTPPPGDASQSTANGEVRKAGSVANGDDAGNAAILKKLPVPVLVYRMGETLYANPELLATTGYSSLEELSAAGGVDALFSPADGDGTLSEGDNGAVPLRRRDGSSVQVSPLLQSVPWLGGRALLLSFRPPIQPNGGEKAAVDIARVAELQNILDTATDGILVTTREGQIESLNAPAEALFGVNHRDAAGLPLTELFAKESHRAVEEYMRELKEPGVAGLINNGREVIGRHAKGGLIPLFLTLGRMGQEEKFCAVLRDITPWKRAEEELVGARRAAESASEQKSEFLARVSHEIRTPLNAIIGFSDVMIEERFGPIDNDRYRGYLRDINRSGVHVLDLINDLLDISKIEAGKMELTYEAVDLNQLVSETVALLQPQANAERIIIRTSLSRAVPRVVADARSIRQIILNLVSNAIKFTPANGQVIVSTVYEGNGEVVMRVRDTGRGMTEREIEHAMKPFHQVNVTDERRGQGTGLGLPLTKALVEANRAYFDLESTPGEGTIAHVHFPTQRVLAD